MMYKKVFLFLLGFLGFFSGIVINYGYGQSFKESDMDNVNINFCNEGTGNLKTEDTIYIDGNKEKNLCLYIMNGGEKKMEFVYGFGVGGFSNSGDPVCDADMSTGNRFSQLIPQTHERNVVIEPMTYQTVQEKIIIPPGMSGMQLGCLVYKLHEPEYKGVGGMFTLEIHKAAHLNIVVGGESDVKSTVKLLDLSGGVFSTSKKVKAEIDSDNNLTVKFTVKNEGNISQNITITGKVYNALGFQKDFVISTKELAPGITNEFVGDIGILPLYKGLFTIKFNVKSDPQFMFPIANQKLKQPGYITEKTSIFVFSRILVIIAILVFFVIYRGIFRRKAIPQAPVIVQP